MKTRYVIPLCMMIFSGLSVAEAQDSTSGVTDVTPEKETTTKTLPTVNSGFRNESVLPSTSPDTGTKHLSQPTNVTSSLLQVTLGLFLVLIIIAGAAWFARRFGQFNVTAKGNLKVLGGLHLSSRERVVLMQVGEKQLLLGIAPGNIRTLHVLEQPLETETSPSASGNLPASPFSSILNKMRGS